MGQALTSYLKKDASASQSASPAVKRLLREADALRVLCEFIGDYEWIISAAVCKVWQQQYLSLGFRKRTALGSALSTISAFEHSRRCGLLEINRHDPSGMLRVVVGKRHTCGQPLEHCRCQFPLEDMVLDACHWGHSSVIAHLWQSVSDEPQDALYQSCAVAACYGGKTDSLDWLLAQAQNIFPKQTTLSLQS